MIYTAKIPGEPEASNGNYVTLSLGKPITAPALIPVHHKATPACIGEPFIVHGKSYKVTCVSFGTPHGAVFVEDVDHIDLGYLGHFLGTHALFPKGASIVFVETADAGHIKARLWQRGVGEVLFTTEAACVAMAAASLLQKVMWEAEVFMGGHTVRIEWDPKDDNVYITGPEGLIRH